MAWHVTGMLADRGNAKSACIGGELPGKRDRTIGSLEPCAYMAGHDLQHIKRRERVPGPLRKTNQFHFRLSRRNEPRQCSMQPTD